MRRSKGFTLVEMMVVVTIICILSGLISAAVFAALNHAKEVMVTVEVRSISTALQHYKTEFGEFPPDGSNPALVESHLRNRFPRIAQAEVNTIKALNINCDTAVVFWLTAFGSSPTHPYSSPGTKAPMITLDKNKLSGLRYYPIQQQGGQAYPLIYFADPTYETAIYGTKQAYKIRDKFSNEARDMYAGDGYQLIHPGYDNDYGAPGSVYYPSGNGFNKGDLDNITSFAKGTTIGDDLP